MVHPAGRRHNFPLIRQIAIAAASLVIGAALGFWLRGDTSPASVTARPAPSSERAGDHIPSIPVAGFSSAVAQSSAITRRQAEDRISRLGKIAGVSERAARFASIMADWARSDPRAAFDYVNSMSDGHAFLKSRAMASIAQVLATQDPRLLEELASSLPPGETRHALISHLVAQMEKNDLEAALKWASTLPDDRSKRDALLFLRTRLAGKDPERAARLLAEMPDLYSRQTLVSSIGTSWGLRDPSKASVWASALPPAEQSIAIPAVTGSWAQLDPLAAANFVAGLPPGSVQDSAAMVVVSYWAAEAPRDAATWVADFPHDDLRDRGVREVVNSWTQLDPASALDWSRSLPDPRVRDHALGACAQGIAHWSPEKAAEIIPLIHDSERSEETIEITMRSWSETNPAAARQWLSQLNIREGLRTRLNNIASGN